MLYGIIGDGTMPPKVVNSTLDDLLEQDPAMWVLLEGKENPTKADQAIVAWLDKNEIVFEAIVKSGTEPDEIYGTATDTHKTKGKITSKFADLLQSHPELQDDGAKVLALYVDFDGENTDDSGIDAILTALSEVDSEIKTYAMNNQMVEVEAEGEPEPEPEPEVPARRTRGKSNGEKDAKGYTEAELSEMPTPELRAIIKSLGLNISSRQKTVLVDGILEAQKGTTAKADEDEEAPRRARSRTREEAAPEITSLTVAGELNGDQVFVVAHIQGGIQAKFVSAEKALALFEV